MDAPPAFDRRPGTRDSGLLTVLDSFRITRFAALPIAVAALAGATAPSAYADDAAPTPESIAGQLGGAFSPSAVTTVQRSPNGAHVLFRRAEQVATPAGGSQPADCSDLWVMQTAGTQATRLTDTCSAGASSTVPFTTGEQWSPDGAITAFGGTGLPHTVGRSTRWTLTPESGTTDRWSARSFAGAGVGYSADGRFWIMQSRDWQYSSTTWSAVRLDTGAEHPVWDEARRGTGVWAPACSAAPAPADAPQAPTYDEVLSTLDGAAPACRFAAAADAPEPPSPIMVWGPRAGVPDAPAPAPSVTQESAATPAPQAPVRQPTLRETTADALLVRAATSRLATILRRGSLTVKVDAPGARSVRAWVILAAPVRASGARTRGLRTGTTIARGRADRVGNGTTALRLPVDASTRRTLRGATAVRATVRVVSTDAAGEVTTAERPLLLRR